MNSLEAQQRLREQRLAMSAIRISVETHFDIGTCERGKARAGLSFISDCFMWLGKALHHLGAPSPYPNSFNPESKQIEPSADIATGVDIKPYADETAFIKGTRADLKQIGDQLTADIKHYHSAVDIGYAAEMAVQTAWVKINDALHRFGECLAEIREERESEVQEVQEPEIGVEEQETYEKGEDLSLRLSEKTTAMTQEQWDAINPQPKFEETPTLKNEEDATATETGDRAETVTEHPSEPAEVSAPATPVRRSGNSKDGAAAGAPKRRRGN